MAGEGDNEIKSKELQRILEERLRTKRATRERLFGRKSRQHTCRTNEARHVVSMILSR